MKYKKLLTSLVLTLHLSAYCQVSDTTYLSKDNEVAPKSEAIFYRLLERHENDEKKLYGRTYFISGQLRSQVIYDDESYVNNSSCFTLFENGNKQVEGQWSENLQIGEWKNWYENGQIKEIGHYKLIKGIVSFTTYSLDEYWDSSGNQIVENGVGEITYYHESSNKIESQGSYENGEKVGVWKGYGIDSKPIYEETYISGKVNGVSWDSLGNSYNYTAVEEQPNANIGIVEFYKFVSKNLVYPRDARRKGIQGKIYVQFNVNENGLITDVETVKGLSKSIDEEAERVIKSSPKWEPAKKRGQPVSLRMILPFTFKLG